MIKLFLGIQSVNNEEKLTIMQWDLLINADDLVLAQKRRLEKLISKQILEWVPVSYTHLDVYKRQGLCLSYPEKICVTGGRNIIE